MCTTFLEASWDEVTTHNSCRPSPCRIRRFVSVNKSLKQGAVVGGVGPIDHTSDKSHERLPFPVGIFIRRRRIGVQLPLALTTSVLVVQRKRKGLEGTVVAESERILNLSN
jgi:hypothetical protein